MYTLYDVGNASFNLLHTFPGLQYSTSNGYKNTDDRTFTKVLILTFVTKNDSTCDKKIQYLKVTNSTRFSKIFKLLPTLAFFLLYVKSFHYFQRSISEVCVWSSSRGYDSSKLMNSKPFSLLTSFPKVVELKVLKPICLTQFQCFQDLKTTLWDKFTNETKFYSRKSPSILLYPLLVE